MKEKIIELLQMGYSYSKIVDLVGCSKATISYHAKKLGVSKPFTSYVNKYAWKEIQDLLDSGATQKEVKKKFHINNDSWKKAVESKKLIYNKPVNIPISELLVIGRKTSNDYLKKRLLREGLIENKCSECGINTVWNNKNLNLQLDHVNGINNDNRIENLRLLCPNCHSQTVTFGSRNKKFLRGGAVVAF